VPSDYELAEAQVIAAGRALELALESGDEFEVQLAAGELLRVGSAREARQPGVAGFHAEDVDAEQIDPDVELENILSELEIGHTLVAAGAVVGEPQTSVTPAEEQPTALGDVLDQLEADRRRRLVGPQSTAGFGPTAEPDAPPLGTFRNRMDTCLDQIVTGTKGVAADAVHGLGALPAAIVQPWLAAAGSLVGDIPKVGALAALGLRAIRRALNALLSLVPASWRAKVAELATTWWGEKGLPGIIERILGVEEVRTRADEVLADEPDPQRLRTGAESLQDLTGRHTRSTGIIRKVLKVLTALVGPLAASFAAAAPWLYAAAAAGYGAAVSTSLWIGRDVLDTGAGWERVAGVQVVLAGLTP